MSERYFRFMELPVAGLQYRTTKHVLETVAVGDVLLLEREPENQHDKHAVRVKLEDGRHVGYVPRDHSATISRMLEFGYSVKGMCAAIEPAKPSMLVRLFLPKLSGENPPPEHKADEAGG